LIEVRTAARLLLLDANRRILLFRYNDRHGREFWATPGGGVEPGESLEEAARREAAEELGAEEAQLTRLWTGHSRFPFADRQVSQTETFFLVTSRSDLPSPAVREVHRREGITEARWWSLDEIEATVEPLYPTDLATRMREYLHRSRSHG